MINRKIFCKSGPCTSFIMKCLNSCNSVVHSVSRNGVYGMWMLSPIGANVQFCCNYYGMSLNDIPYVNKRLAWTVIWNSVIAPDLEKINLIKELLSVKSHKGYTRGAVTSHNLYVRAIRSPFCWVGSGHTKWTSGQVCIAAWLIGTVRIVEVCMGMGKTGIPWVPWDSHENGSKISHGMGMGWEWELSAWEWELRRGSCHQQL